MEEAAVVVEQTPEKEAEPVIFSPVAESLLSVFAQKESPNHEPKITVNRFVSEVANWYEKLRNAMDYRDEEVVLRASIERILKRRLGMKRNSTQKGLSVAEPLLKELVWAHYFPNGTLPESYTQKVGDIIDVWVRWRKGVKARYVMRDGVLNLWFYQLLSSHIARFLNPQVHRNTMSNFMFFVMKDEIHISDDSVEQKDVQVYLAVRRAYAKDDIAFLRFALFEQIFGSLSIHTVESAIHGFKHGYQEIKKQLSYKLKEKIYQNIKKQTPVFLILEDVLASKKGKIEELFGNEEEFQKAVYDACDKRYKSIRRKVSLAILRNVVFLLVTKAIFALAIEGTYDKYVYGNIGWLSILLNIGIPPILLIIVSLLITQPKEDNSKRILDKIKIVLTEESPKITPVFVVAKKPKKTAMHYVFACLWFLAFFLSFGTMQSILSSLHFNIVSQAVFIFFIAIVSFLAYGISSTAHQYMVDPKPGLFTPFIDFLFIPIVRVGRWFTDGISSINVIVFLFDYVIEIPFKAIFGFFDQLFWYLHTKREELE
ncbi:MAG TPA: hypothetical protein VLB73_03565 [Patescibacteria group bacterium]|nr:hypothetical protein [Patescibacteria group bacterium]